MQQSTRINILVSVIMSVFLFSSHNAIAHELGHWGAGSNKVWKSGFGECWDTGFPGNQRSGCGEPAPVEAPSDAIYWNDEDGDGVHDADDACPKTPLGVPVNSSGCVDDSDGDGVPDYLDKCPGTPLGTVVDTDGCAIKIVSLEGVHFAFDSANLTSVAKSILDNAARAINAHSAAHFTIEGHTDSYGSDDYNQGLSERRAQSVKSYLISKGVSSSRLSAVGKGESYPVASNDNREGRAENRRVDVLAR